MWTLMGSATILCLLPTVVFGQYNHGIPFGARLKNSKHVRRQADDFPGDDASEHQRTPRGFVYQTPLYLVNPGYTYVTPATTEAPRGYVYKKPTTTFRPKPRSTTPEPAIESEHEIDSAFLTPAPPPPSFPEKEFEESPVEVDDRPDKWDIRDSVPGTPGQDYPVLSKIPKTSFICEGRIPGYYADPETQCQVFHRCSDCTDNVRLYMDSFLCPNGTQFNQEILACDWWGNVHCENTLNYYKINEELNQLGPDGKYLQLSGMRHAPPLAEKKLAPAIIPKSERRPLPSIYRSKHDGSSNDEHGEPQDVRPTQPPRNPIIFNEFRKPIAAPAKPRPLSNNNEIESALNNPDYFNPNTRVGSSKNTPTNTDELSDEDYFNENGQVEVRSSIEFAQKLDNEALNPAASNGMGGAMRMFKLSAPYQAGTTSVAPPTRSTATTFKTPKPFSTTTTFKTPKPYSTSTTLAATTSRTTTLGTTLTTQLPETTFYETTTTPSYESSEEGNEIQPLVGLQGRAEENEDDASGFIANQPPPNIRDYNGDRNKNGKLAERKQTPAPSTIFDPPPPLSKEDDIYLPPTRTTYAPPTSKPKLNYLPPASTPRPEYGPPKDSYLPPKDSYLPPAVATVSALPVYPGNPYAQAPLPQQTLIQPSVFNYIPFPHGGYSTPQFRVVGAQVPLLSYPGGAALPTYLNGGPFNFAALTSANYFTPNYYAG